MKLEKLFKVTTLIYLVIMVVSLILMQLSIAAAIMVKIQVVLLVLVIINVLLYSVYYLNGDVENNSKNWQLPPAKKVLYQYHGRANSMPKRYKEYFDSIGYVFKDNDFVDISEWSEIELTNIWEKGE